MFQIVALPRETFVPLFDQDDTTLAARGIVRRTAEGGEPCRVSLEDAAPGETVYLLPHVHHDVSSPYRACGPIYVRERAETARLEPDAIPATLDRRLLSVRGYDEHGMLVQAEVLEGTALRDIIQAMFADATIAYLHVHNARPGCFNCRIERAG